MDAAIVEAEACGGTAEKILLDAGVINGRQLMEATRHRWGLEALPAGGAASNVPDAHTDPGPLPARVRPADRPVRAGLARVFGILSTASAVAAAVVAVDIVMTLTWQEPISAIYASRSQAALERELGEIRVPVVLPGASEPTLAERAAQAADRARTGAAIGSIELPTLDTDFVMVQGVDEGSLQRGPGHFPDTAFPGQGETVAVAGHRTTYLAPFRRINELDPGDPIVVSMPYGRIRYEVEQTRIVDPDDYGVTRPVGYERLVITGCHPLYSAAQRIVVFARRADATTT